MMIATNELTNLKCHKKEVLQPLVRIIAPFAPFVAEELWQRLGNTISVHLTNWPPFDATLLVEDTIEYPVSINGKMRVKINLPADIKQVDAEPVVLANEVVQKWVDGKPLKKFIFVPKRIVNIVV